MSMRDWPLRRGRRSRGAGLAHATTAHEKSRVASDHTRLAARRGRESEGDTERESDGREATDHARIIRA